MSTLRRRYAKWCKGDDVEDCTHKQRYEASYQSMVKVLQQNTWIDDRKFLKSCVRARVEQGSINHPAYGTWTTDFMLRENESSAFLGKYLNDPRVPWRHKRREMMAISGIIPVAKWLAKIKQRSDVGGRLCTEKGTRTTRCEHWKFARRDICAHQQCFTQAHTYNQHTRGIATTRHRSLEERGGKKALLETLHTHTKRKCKKNPIFTNLEKRFEHIKLPAKLLDYLLRSNKSNINQSAMEWRQPSRLPTTSSGDICIPACKLHKHQRVSSGVSHLINRAV